MPNNLSWALLDFCYTHWNVGLVIVSATNHPCHLTAYITDKPPLKHPLTRVLRGLITPWGAYHCFVAYTEYEQTEPGDTLIHTFWINDWHEHQKRWWLLKGTMDGGQESLSNSPIIEHTHPGGMPEFVNLRPNNPGDLCTIRDQTGNPCPNHWLNLKEVVPDEEATMIWNYWLVTDWKDDLYRFQTIAEPNILNITIYARFKSVGTRPGTRVLKLGIKTHGVYSQTTTLACTLAWQYKSWSHDTNPVTGNAWTPVELNDLQAGVSCSYVTGVGWAQMSYCTQIFLTVHRGLCIPNPHPGPYP